MDATKRARKEPNKQQDCTQKYKKQESKPENRVKSCKTWKLESKQTTVRKARK